MYLDNLWNLIEFEGHTFKVKFNFSTWVFFCVHDAAAIRGQYSASGKAW